jgi:sulfite reductase (NADPH) flavoprotein alpha-component
MTYRIVPESAPFSPEQRAWLDGFLAGMLGVLDNEKARGGSSSGLAAAAALGTPPPGDTVIASNEEESFPWHDSSLAISDRMKLADGKPVERKLMAAMAQLNCGSCGYLCKTYAEAIANGSEKNLTLCSPGGSETAKMVRLVIKENASTATGTNSSSKSQPTPQKALPGTRDNPVTAKLITSDRLNGSGSAKDTRHVEINLDGTNLTYRVGDALGIWPSNCDGLIRSVLAASSLDASTVVEYQSIGQPKQSVSLALALEGKCLRSIPALLVELGIENIKNRPKQNGSVAKDAKLIDELQAFLESDEMFDWDVLEFIERFPTVDWSPQAFLDSLSDQRPRLYSIASSQSKFPTQVHLTVGRVENDVRGRKRKGVASTMLADRVQAEGELRVFIHPSHGFTVPADPNAPMLMVGPGTGIAPFMAFLQQREADGAKGKNWLFFGDQKESCDFLYKEQLLAWQATGLLSRLDTAFSRDGADKVYVQHRMMENGEQLYAWLEQGGYFFVCGDASRMAVDVDKALHQVIAKFGGKSESQAKEYVQQMTQQKRYVRDVY